MKKFLSLVLALVMTMSLVTISAGAKDFTDDSSITYKEAVDVISTIGVVDGYTDGSFNPTATLTRGAAAKIICNLRLGPTVAAELSADTAPYSDVPVDSTFAGYIAYCQKEGIISGYADGTFRPAGTLTSYAFMKMLLGALGYDSEIEGYTGNNWSVAVAKRALNIGLNDGLKTEFNGVSAVTREQAALYSLNTLKADLVEYGNKITVTNTDGSSVTVGNSSAASKTWSNATQATSYNNIYNAYDDNGTIQFAEEYFNKLVLSNSGDAFGRPATVWYYKGVKVGTYAEDADATYYKDVKLNAIYSDLGMTSKANSTTLYVNGVQVAMGTANVAKSDDTKLSAISSKVGNGTIVEAFLDTDSNDVTICVISVYGGKITDVKDATSKKDAYVVVDGGTTAPALLSTGSNDEYETTDFAEDDVVAYTFSEQAGEIGIKDMYKMESVEGTLTKRVATKSVQLADTTYTYAKEYTFDTGLGATTTAAEGNLSNKSSYVVYKDDQGYALWIEESKFGVDAYAYIEAITNSGDGLGADRARLVLSDGTKKTVELDKDYKTQFSIETATDGTPVVTGTGPTGTNTNIKEAYIVRYTENSDGTYKLTNVTTAANTASNTDTFGIASRTVTSSSISTNYDSETIFVVKKSGENSWKVYTGIKSAPNVTFGSTDAAYQSGVVNGAVAVYVRDNVAKLVFIDSADSVTGSSSDITFLATKSATKVNKSTNDGVDYYVYNAVVDGSITTVSVEATETISGASDTLASGATTTTGSLKGLIVNVTNYSAADDEVIHSTNFSSSSVTVGTGHGVKKYSDTKVKINNSLKDLASKCSIYTVDDDGVITEIEASDIKTNSAADAIYTMEDGEITNLFIILPAD